jgi:hypothetical protein
MIRYGIGPPPKASVSLAPPRINLICPKKPNVDIRIVLCHQGIESRNQIICGGSRSQFAELTEPIIMRNVQK